MSSEFRPVCETSHTFCDFTQKTGFLLCQLYAISSWSIVIFSDFLIYIDQYYRKDKFNYNTQNTKENEKKSIA